jgi:DNA-directed RNA polymerase subunit RPC12/RpoP
MKKEICMVLKCVECGTKHEIPSNKVDDFNIYHVLGQGGNVYVPQLLCLKCTKKFSKKVV